MCGGGALIGSLMAACGQSLMAACGQSLMAACGQSLMAARGQSLMAARGQSLMAACGQSRVHDVHFWPIAQSNVWHTTAWLSVVHLWLGC